MNMLCNTILTEKTLEVAEKSCLIFLFHSLRNTYTSRQVLSYIMKYMPLKIDCPMV